MNNDEWKNPNWFNTVPLFPKRVGAFQISCSSKMLKFWNYTTAVQTSKNHYTINNGCNLEPREAAIPRCLPFSLRPQMWYMNVWMLNCQRITLWHCGVNYEVTMWVGEITWFAIHPSLHFHSEEKTRGKKRTVPKALSLPLPLRKRKTQILKSRDKPFVTHYHSVV